MNDFLSFRSNKARFCQQSTINVNPSTAPDFSGSEFHIVVITFLTLAAAISDMFGFSLLIHKKRFLSSFQTMLSVEYKGRYTLRDKLQQHVTATDHSVCTGPATSCSNMLRRHIAATNRFVYWRNFVNESLFLQQPFCRGNMLQKNKSDRICATCCDVSPQHVTATSCRTCTHRVICRRDVLLQLFA